MNELEQKIKKSRVQLLLRHPFYATIVLKRPFVVDKDCPFPAWTDGEVIGYNPEQIKDFSVEELIWLWAHEGSHIARKHHLRIFNRDHVRWNYATDYQMNNNLESDGLQRPALAIHDPQYKGMSSDAIYEKLPPMRGGEDGGDGKDKKGTDRVKPWPGKKGQKPTKAEVEAESKKVDAEVLDAAKMAEKRGKLPGDMAKLVEDLKNPLVDWRHLLRQYIQTSAKDDHTWRRPNRRFAWQNIYLPSLWSERIGEVVVAVDTSGSTYGHQEQFVSEVAAIARELRPSKLHLLYCDTSVSAESFDNMDDLTEFSPRGGGGTSFVPVFDWVDEQAVTPCVLVYLTDMWGEFPEIPPNYPVIWVDCQNNGSAPFGDYVPLREET